jgi:hypothetical protein
MMKKELMEKIKKMLEEERKRREIALSFLSFLKEELPPVCVELYGRSGKHVAIWLWGKDHREKNIYFRYAPFTDTEDRVEEIG